MTKTETEVQKLEAGAVFGYREVISVTRDNVTYRNLNGRKSASGKPGDRKEHTVSKKDFKTLVGI